MLSQIILPDNHNKDLEELNELRELNSKKLDEINHLIESAGLNNHNITQKIAEIKEKLYYMVNIYSISPKEFTKLKQSWRNHLIEFEGLLNSVYSANDSNFQSAIPRLIDEILEYNKVITEQYLQFVIEGTYYGIFDTNRIPSLPIHEANGKLAYSIKILEEFFNQIIKNDISPSSSLTYDNFLKIQTTLRMIEKREDLPPKTSTYFILIAKLLDKREDIGQLDERSVGNIIYTMNSVLKELEQKYLNPENTKENQLQPSHPMTKMKIDVLHINMDQVIWKKAEDIFLEVFGLYYQHYQDQLLVDLCNLSHFTLVKMHNLYLKTPQDFPGLFLTFYDEAIKFKSRSYEHHVKRDVYLLNKGLTFFYEHMTRRHFQMQVCVLYNSICCDRSLSIEVNNDWQDSFTAIITFLNDFYEKLEKSLNQGNLDQKKIGRYFNIMTKINELKKAFNTLNNVILLEEDFSPAIKYARQCIVGLSKLFIDFTEIRELSPAIFEKIIDTVNDMQKNLTAWLNNSLEGSNDNYILNRMKIERVEKQPKEQENSSMNTVKQIPVLVVNSVAHKLFHTVYSAQKYSSSFSFFSERQSAKALRKIAKSYGLVCKNVPENGNCLFSAVALALQLKESHPEFLKLTLHESAQKLRDMANGYLEKHADIYKDFVAKVPANTTKEDKKYVAEENFQEYMKKMEKPNECGAYEWGDHYHVIALCEVLKIKIVVLNSDGSQPIITGVKDAVAEICLGYEVSIDNRNDGVHYQTLVPLDKTNELPQKVRDLLNSDKVDFIKPRI